MSKHTALFGGKVKLWDGGGTVPIDQKALAQVLNTSNLPFIHHHVALMPDAHLGIGATVGSVVATKGAIIPAAVGVDIGCGMMAVRTDMDANDLPPYAKIRGVIENNIPVGDAKHQHTFPDLLMAWTNIADYYYEQVKPLAKAILENADPFMQLGTLGGGNHFIEVCVDEAHKVWIVLHSGSRGVGNKIGRYFIELAREDMRKHFINLPDKDLAYLVEGTEHFDEYWTAVKWAQEYAKFNRQLMMQQIFRYLCEVSPMFKITDYVVNCHHNYVDREHHFGENVLVTRKGAVRAREGDLGIIPGSMGARTYIVRGLGNPISFNSCSHGAGRTMSRSEAKKRYTIQDVALQTVGIECRKDEGIIDEIPSAYKSIDAVMAAQTDLVETLHTLRQVVCVKG